MAHPGSPKRLLMVRPTPRSVRNAVAAGYRVWSVWDPALADDDCLDEVERHSVELLLADFSAEPMLRALVEATARANGIRTVLHLRGADGTGALLLESEALDLILGPGRPESLERPEHPVGPESPEHPVGPVDGAGPAGRQPVLAYEG